MSDTVAVRLPARVLLAETAFSLAIAGLLGALGPELLLLEATLVPEARVRLLVAPLAAGLVTLLLSGLALRRRRPALRALALGSALEPFELRALERLPWRVGATWAVPNLVALGLAMGPLRPSVLDPRESASLGLLSAASVMAAALLLVTLVRRAAAAALELAPAQAAHEMIEQAQAQGLARRLLLRRVLLAFVPPVAFVALGATLIVGAHLRRAEEQAREDTALALTRAAFEPGPGLVPEAGIHEAALDAAAAGFTVTGTLQREGYSLARERAGRLALTVPVGRGSVRVAFRGSDTPVADASALLATLLGVSAAALVGLLLGRALDADLAMATAGVRALGTETPGRPMRRARFRSVENLSRAVAGLTHRFRVFAKAQERALRAREAAARARAMLFASVSHDLRSPLNAVLGFAELTRLEPLTAEQQRSLDIIDRRGRELLALIETILDAARLEAQRFSLVFDTVRVEALLEETVEKARVLAGEREVELTVRCDTGLPDLRVDGTRLARGLAALIGYALRMATDGASVEVSAERDDDTLRITIGLGSARLSLRRVETLLGGRSSPSAEHHRGLALAVGLAARVVELHGGSVEASADGRRATSFTVTLPLAT